MRGGNSHQLSFALHSQHLSFPGFLCSFDHDRLDVPAGEVEHTFFWMMFRSTTGHQVERVPARIVVVEELVLLQPRSTILTNKKKQVCKERRKQARQTVCRFEGENGTLELGSFTDERQKEQCWRSKRNSVSPPIFFAVFASSPLSTTQILLRYFFPPTCEKQIRSSKRTKEGKKLAKRPFCIYKDEEKECTFDFSSP